MEMKKLILPLLLSAILPAGAQTLHESISVEGKYVPDIIRIDRLYSFPQATVFPMEATPMTYDRKGVAAAFEPTLMTMPVTGWRVSRDVKRHRGYLEADLGSYLNSNLSAGYRFVDTPATSAGAWLQFNSSSLWRHQLAEPTDSRRRSRYDGTVGVYANHSFDEAGRLETALSWHTGYFNYFMTTPMIDSEAPTQTLNDISFRAGWLSQARKDAVVWHADAGARYFGYRAFYLPQLPEVEKPARETRLSLDAGIAMPWDSGSEVGLDANFDVMLYSMQNNISYGDIRLQAPTDYTQLALTPYYRFSRGLLNIKAGAEIDFTFHAGLPGERYSLLHVSPDVAVDFRSGPAGLYLNLGGGSELQTLAAAHELDYYSMPTLSNTRPVYSPLDAVLGLEFGPFSGFSAGVEFAYKVTNRVPLGGWYAFMLSDRVSPWADDVSLSGMTPLYGFDTEGLTIKGMSLGLNLRYTTGRTVTFKASGHYQPQKGSTGFFNGYDRPRWVLDAGADFHPWKGLGFSVGYSYRGVRTIYTRLTELRPAVSFDGKGHEGVVAGMRLPDLTLLNAGISYDFTPDFGLRIDALNLLGRHDALLPGLPSEGLCVTGGLRILF